MSEQEQMTECVIDEAGDGCVTDNHPAGKFVDVTDTAATPGAPPRRPKEYIAWAMEAFGLTRADAKRQYRLMQRSKVYQSDLYLVHVLEPQEPGGVTHLSIRRQDRCSGTDWREFQDIKNQLCGPEREAVEIYPAESRLVDGANQYHLWVLPEDKQIPFGFNDGRQVDMMPSVPNGSQRGDDGIERHNHPVHGVIEIEGGDA